MPRIDSDDDKTAFVRFGLRDGQIRSDRDGFPFAKNQWWFLTLVKLGSLSLGYGDLSQDEVLAISEKLEDGEVFTTFNEAQGMTSKEKFRTPFEMNMTPRMIITNKEIRFPQEEERTA